MNDHVQKCWNTALALLRPTEAQLQHGLELHRDALVFETYGFAPNACFDGAALAAAAEEGASAVELQDLREDMSMTRWATVPAEREEFKQAFDFAGVNCIFQNAGEEGQTAMRLARRLARFTFSTDVMRDFVCRAAFPDDISAAHARGGHCLYFTGNGVPLVEDWITPHDELRFIRIFFQLGIRMMHLTYNRRNMIGEGCAESSNAGLSDFGRMVIAEMNKQGVIVDCAHSGWQTSLEAAQASSKPMVASHSACAALQPHHRCKPDEVIRAICDTDGMIGICWVPGFLGGSGTIVEVLNHVDYVVRNYGAQYVGLGSDTSYTPQRQAEEWSKYPRVKERKRWNNFWWPNDPLYDPKFQKPEQRESLAWTNWPLMTVGMVQRGYSDDDIRQILGGNMMRVAQAAVAGLGLEA
ncbi:dipeptidase [bacterium]|nr:dipeptidase [bacterium]